MGARHLGIGVETTYGTAATTTTNFFEVRRENLAETAEFEEVPSIRSVSPRQVVPLNAAVKNDFELTFDFQSIGILLRWFFGVAPDTDAGPPIVHTFPPSTGLAADSRIGVSYTVEVRREDDTFYYLGAKLPTLNIVGSTDGVATVSGSVLAKSSNNTAPTASPTYLDFDIAKPSQLSVEVDGLDVDPKSFELNMAWPLDEPYGLGSERFATEPDDDGPLSVSGQFVAYFTDTTEYDKFVTRADVDVTITLADADHSLILNMNKCRITAVGIPVEGRGRIMATFSFTSFFDTVATENIQAVLTNDVASYA